MLTFSLKLKKHKRVIPMGRNSLQIRHHWLIQIMLGLNLFQDRIVKKVSKLLLFLIDIQAVKLNVLTIKQIV